jgi:hypothetical protein
MRAPTRHGPQNRLSPQELGRLTIQITNAPLAQHKHDLSRVRSRAVCLITLNHSGPDDLMTLSVGPQTRTSESPGPNLLTRYVRRDHDTGKVFGVEERAHLG